MMIRVTHTDETEDTVVSTTEVKDLADLINALQTTKHLTNKFLTTKLQNLGPCADSQDSAAESSVCSE
jgi:hypothetical protein